MTQTLDGNPIPASVNSSARIGGTQDAVDATFTPDLLNAYPRAISTITGLQAALDAAVKLTGSQTVGGIKNFSTGIVVPTESLPLSAVTGLEDALVAVSTGATLVAAPGGVDDTFSVTTARGIAGVGGTMVFGPGTYVVTGLAASVSNQHWVIPPGTTVKTKNSSNTPTIDVTANGVTIDGGGTIDGNRANQSDATYGLASCVRIISRTGVTVQGLTIRDSLSIGVYIDASTSVTVDHNTISGCGPTGNHKQVLVYDTVGSSSDIEITNNRIDSTSIVNGCIAITTSVAARTIRRVRITGNYCKLGDSGATPTLGIELFTAGTATISDFTVEGNIVEGPTGVISTDQVYGISIGGTATSAGYGAINGTVTGNVVRNCPFASIEIVGVAVACAANTCINSGPLSVSALSTTGGLFGVSVTGNTLLNCISPAYAIHLHGGANGLYGCVVSGNTVRGGVAAAAVYSEGIVSGASITANTVTDADGTAVTLLGTFTDSTIANNVFDLTGTAGTIDGILIGATTVARVAITGNIIKGAGQHGIYGLVATSDIDVKDNRITGCENGLRVDAVGTRWTVVGNTIVDNDDRGLIFLVAAVDLSIASNTIDGNPGGDYYTTGSTFLTHVINGAGG